MTDERLPEPPISPDADLRDFPYVPIFRAKLFGSRFQALTTDEEWRVGVTLWLNSWDQVPAGSLPACDLELCRLAELGRDVDAWMRVKAGAMRGWYECSDGRLYHRIVNEGARRAWDEKLKQRYRTECARIRKYSNRHDELASKLTFDEWRATEIAKSASRYGTPNFHENSCDIAVMSQGQVCDVPLVSGGIVRDVTPMSHEQSCDVTEDNAVTRTSKRQEREVSKIAVVHAREDFRELEGALREAAGPSLMPSSRELSNLARPLAWISAGCDLELDIVATIRRITANCPPGTIRTWQYFEGAVAGAKQERLNPHGVKNHDRSQSNKSGYAAKLNANLAALFASGSDDGGN